MDIKYSVLDFDNIEDFCFVDLEKNLELSASVFKYAPDMDYSARYEFDQAEFMLNDMISYYNKNRSFMRRNGNFYFAHLARKLLWSVKQQKEEGVGYEFSTIIDDFNDSYGQLVEHRELKIRSNEYYNELRIAKMSKEKEKTKTKSRGWLWVYL